MDKKFKNQVIPSLKEISCHPEREVLNMQNPSIPQEIM
jgi:hypothetical protein